MRWAGQVITREENSTLGSVLTMRLHWEDEDFHSTVIMARGDFSYDGRLTETGASSMKAKNLLQFQWTHK